MYFVITLWVAILVLFASLTIGTGVVLVREWNNLNNEACGALVQAFLTGFMATFIMTVLLFL